MFQPDVQKGVFELQSKFDIWNLHFAKPKPSSSVTFENLVILLSDISRLRDFKQNEDWLITEI
jgi:hypothetical protein